MKRTGNIHNFIGMVFLLGLYVFLMGCASQPVVEATQEELQAASRFKKTVAIIQVSEHDSPIKGVQSVSQSGLENILVGHFNVVERERVQSVLAERDFGNRPDAERYNELGKLLGADYLVFSNTVASIRGPEIRQSQYTANDGSFHGTVWDELCSEAEVTMKIVDVSSAIISYSDKKRNRKCQRENEESFRDIRAFNRSMQYRRTARSIIQVVGAFTTLERQYSTLVSHSLDGAVSRFDYDLRTKFAQTGQVMEIVSEKEIIVNLGSAFGVRPGNRLIVWREQAPFKDPRTGLVTVPKDKLGTLRVTAVTSGLTCVAKGSKKLISQIRIGDKVYTH